MSLLLEKIRRTYHGAAKVLEEANLRTDSCIQSLTREDLRDLFPGPMEFQRRKHIFEMIQEQKPADELIRKLKASIQDESVAASLTSSGVLFDYLHVLKGMKTQVNTVQGFLDAHIELLEEFSRRQPDQESNGDSCMQPMGKASTSDTHNQVEHHSDQSGGHFQESQVMYQVVVSGKTFGAHLQLMQEVLKSSNQPEDRLQFVRSSEDHLVTVLFCPICSRVGSDVDAAMSDVKDDKPVILVMMHHTHAPKPTPSVQTSRHYSDIVLAVNVFFHETMSGLLKCEENNFAASAIRRKLLEYATLRPRQSSANARVVGSESAATLSRL